MRRESAKKYETVKILLEISRLISSTLDFDKVVDLVLRESRNALQVDHASLFLVDAVSGKLMLVRAAGFSRDELDNIKILGSWEAVNNQLIKRKRPLIVNDITRSPAFSRKKLPFLKERLPLKSFLAVPLMKESGGIVGVLIVSNRTRSAHAFTEVDEELLVALSHHISIALLNAKLYEDLKAFFISTVTALIRAVDAKDAYTRGHSEHVMAYSVAIGKELKLDEDVLENLRLSSLLHDIGKIGISEAILSKPSGLVGYEKKLIKRHPMIGARIVESIDNAHRIINGIAQHHEWYNGRGYPNNLKGRAISLEGRVIAVADAYDALTTKRSYQKPFSSKEAFFEIKRGSGEQFDPTVVNAFIRSFSKHPLLWSA